MARKKLNQIVRNAAITAPKPLSKRVLANQAAKREADTNRRAAAILAAAYTETAEQFTTDEKGRKVRVSRATYDEVAHFLLGNRVVDTIDILAELGALAFDAMIANGYIRKDTSTYSRFSASNLYWVTKKAQGHYKLPARIRLSDDCTVAYA